MGIQIHVRIHLLIDSSAYLHSRQPRWICWKAARVSFGKVTKRWRPNQHTRLPVSVLLRSFNSIHRPLFPLSLCALIFKRTYWWCFRSIDCFSSFSYAVGTAHGFALINFDQNRVLMAKCTLDPNALPAPAMTPLSTGQAVITRGRSLKKSLRESFRRLRKGRTAKKTTMIGKRIDEENAATSPNNSHFEETRRLPVERQVEAREFKTMDDYTVSMVRCAHFATTHLNSGRFHPCASLSSLICSSTRSNPFTVGWHQCWAYLCLFHHQSWGCVYARTRSHCHRSTLRMYFG